MSKVISHKECIREHNEELQALADLEQQPGRIARFFWRLFGVTEFGVPNLKEGDYPPMPPVKPPRKEGPTTEQQPEPTEVSKNYSRVLDAVIAAFATTNNEIIQQKVQVAVDQGREVCRELDRQAKENRQAVKFLEEALPHITCENDFQSGLITAIGTFLQALKERKARNAKEKAGS